MSNADQIPADDGCQFAPSCLTCPLPVCKEDSYRAAKDAFTLLGIVGMSAETAAEKLNVTVRTIFRIKSRNAKAF